MIGDSPHFQIRKTLIGNPEKFFSSFSARVNGEDFLAASSSENPSESVYFFGRQHMTNQLPSLCLPPAEGGNLTKTNIREATRRKIV
jgi:hypothetical protein